MPRPRVSVPIEAIRIEDEVWQDAFALAQDVAKRRSQDLYAVDGGRAAPVRLASEPAGTAATPSPPATMRPVAVAPRPARAGSTADYPRVRVAAATSPPVAAAASAVAETVDVDVPSSPAGSAGATRRTVTIRGYGAERNLPWPSASRRRPARPIYERAGFRPDRVALWAVLLGVLLVVVAVASAHS